MTAYDKTWDTVQLGDKVRITKEFTVDSFAESNPTWDRRVAYSPRPSIIRYLFVEDFQVEVLQKRLRVGDVVKGLPDLPPGSRVLYNHLHRGQRPIRRVRIGDEWMDVEGNNQDPRPVGSNENGSYTIESIAGE